MPSDARARKVLDEATAIRCAAGNGIIREEVWQSEDGDVVKYNLAFINHFLTRADNGRVLGYDNSHGYHHRHFNGYSEPHEHESYAELRERFIREVRDLRGLRELG